MTPDRVMELAIRTLLACIVIGVFSLGLGALMGVVRLWLIRRSR